MEFKAEKISDFTQERYMKILATPSLKFFTTVMSAFVFNWRPFAHFVWVLFHLPELIQGIWQNKCLWQLWQAVWEQGYVALSMSWSFPKLQ